MKGPHSKQTTDKMSAAQRARREREKAGTSTGPGWYWAKWRIAADGTREGDELTPSNEWEVVQVNVNQIDEDNPGHLSVSVTGVEKCQWPDCFVWGPPVTMPAELK